MTTAYTQAMTNNYDGLSYRTRLDYTTSTTNAAVTITASVTLQYKGTYKLKNASYAGGSASLMVHNSKEYTMSTQKPTSSKSDWTNLISLTIPDQVVARSTSDQPSGINYGIKAGFGSGGESVFFTIPALPSYNVTYNANGGSGAPSTQKKYYGKSLTLSSVKPTRTNYVFKRWNTKTSDDGTAYNPGGTYTGNAALSLYAIWYPPYTVSYNANGGSGAPANQTKVYSKNLTLSSTKPTRANYVFRQWNTKSDNSGTAYAPGATYSANAALTLYAIWYPPYNVTYNANGGTGAPATQKKVYNTDLKLSTTKPTRSNATFVSWNTKSDVTGTSYAPGATYSANAALTLYAIWVPKPQITTLTAVRCDADGNDDDEGNYARVKAVWSLDTTVSPSISSGTLTGTVTPQSGGGATAITLSGATSGSGGTATAIVPNLDTDMQYTITVTATAGTQTTSKSVILTRAFFIMDFKAGGEAIGIGRAAPSSGLEVGYKAVFDDTVTSLGDMTNIKPVSPIYAAKDGADLSESDNGLTANHFPGFRTLDARNRIISAYESQVKTDGTTASYMYVRNYADSSTTYAGQKGLKIQMDKTGAVEWTVSDPAKFREAIGAVGNVGDTMTGNLVLKDAVINRDSATPSSDQIGRALTLVDKDGETLMAVRADRNADGYTYARVFAAGEKTDGTAVYNTLSLAVNRAGDRKVAVSDAATWRNGLGLGSLATKDSLAASDIPSLAASKIGSGTLAVARLKAQSALWTGAYYMTDTQTATLSANVSAQMNGIVLVFSYYDGSAQDWNWNEFFVPKKLVADHGGQMHTFIMCGASFANMAVKYLRIYDDKITGHESNNKTGTASGITYVNNKYVLRAVYGV